MKKTLILITIIILSIIPFSYAANDFAYNRLYEGMQPTGDLNDLDDVNITNPAGQQVILYNQTSSEWYNSYLNDSAHHVNASDYWITDEGSLSTINATQFSNQGGVLNIIESWVDSLWCRLTGCTMSGDINMNGNSITGVQDITGTGDILMNRSIPGIGIINSISSNPFGVAVVRADSDSGSFASLLSIGSQFPGANDSANDSGIIAGGGRLIFVNNGLEDIAFAHVTGGGSNFSNASFSFRLRADGDALLSGDLFLEDEDKSIRTVPISGGSSIVFDSNDTIAAGGFPVIEVAKTEEGDRVVTRWSQNGRNNSFSGAMNSLGAVPRSWVNFTGETDQEGIEFLLNRSDYVKYCDYLQNNLSLIPEGCEYFADTNSRLVPLLFGGDLEVHRTGVIHEGLTVFNNLDFIGRNGNDVDLLFNGALEDGQLHIRDKRQIETNITFFDVILTDFDDGTISPFASTSVLPEVGRDWNSVVDNECFDDRCGNAKGGNEKVMQFSFPSKFVGGTVASNNSRVLFWLSSILSGGDNFNVTLDDNQGNVSTIYSATSVLVDEFVNVSFGQVFENKSNITMRFILDGQNINREVWVDIIRITSEPDEPILINESFDGGRTIWGEDRGDLSCGIDIDKQVNNVTLDTEWIMNIGSAGCAVDIIGNVTFTDSTVTNQTVVGEQTITGNATFQDTIFVDSIREYTASNGVKIWNNLSVSENATFDSDVIITGTLFGGSPVKVAGGLNVTSGDAYVVGNLSVFDLNVRSGSSLTLANSTFENFGHYTSVDENFMVNDSDQPTAFLGVFAKNVSTTTRAALVLDALGSPFNIVKNSPLTSFAANSSAIINEGTHGTFVPYDSHISWWHFDNLTKDEYENIDSLNGMQRLMMLNDTYLNLETVGLNVNGDVNIDGDLTIPLPHQIDSYNVYVTNELAVDGTLYIQESPVPYIGFDSTRTTSGQIGGIEFANAGGRSRSGINGYTPTYGTGTSGTGELRFWTRDSDGIKDRVVVNKTGSFITGIIHSDELLKLDAISLPTCDSGTAGSIGRNSTKFYACDGSSWNALY